MQRKEQEVRETCRTRLGQQICDAEDLIKRQRQTGKHTTSFQHWKKVLEIIINDYDADDDFENTIANIPNVTQRDVGNETD